MSNFPRPQPPVFKSIAEDRLYRKQRLAAAFRLFAQFGFTQGIAGHITARDPELTDHFWVNTIGKYFGHIRVSDLVLVNEQGHIVEGEGVINQAAFAIHSQIHQARPDVIAAAHAHSIYGKTWSSLGRLIQPITQDSCAFYQDIALFEEYTGVVLGTSEGKRLANALADKKAIILRNHGILTVGHTVDEAAWWYINLERSCQTQLLAEAVGKPILINHEIASLAHSQVGSHESGWLSFQPLYDKILREEPDLLD
jgi:ribulose-5-phosphate 4-epimerase/fuculose-1-phosphate aldolase